MGYIILLLLLLLLQIAKIPKIGLGFNRRIKSKNYYSLLLLFKTIIFFPYNSLQENFKRISWFLITHVEMFNEFFNE